MVLLRKSNPSLPSGKLAHSTLDPAMFAAGELGFAGQRPAKHRHVGQSPGIPRLDETSITDHSQRQMQNPGLRLGMALLRKSNSSLAQPNSGWRPHGDLVA
jgi:hypothetical protein